MSIGYESGGTTRRRKSPSAYFRERQLKRAARRVQSQDRQQDGEIVPALRFADIFWRESLFWAFQQLKHDNGPGAGIDRISYDVLSNRDAGIIAGQLEEVIQLGEYRPTPSRPVKIPKPGTDEHRTLQLSVVGDRMVAKALQNALTPRLEQVYLPGSYGFRPNRSFWDLLIDLEAKIQTTGMTVVAVADIRQAFDNVDINAASQAFKNSFKEPVFGDVEKLDLRRLRTMIEIIMRGHKAGREVGIDQGNPFSPAVLNVLLHYAHDVKCKKRGTSWFRYADNLLYLAEDAEEGRRLLRHTENLLDKVKMTLKTESVEVVDLATEPLAVFGINAQLQDNKLHFALGEQPWTKLKAELLRLHDGSNPQEKAACNILGWANSYGPACEKPAEVVKKLSRIAGEIGFQEIDWSHVQDQLLKARRRFGELRDRASRRS
jgi:retron-type reverse transcriptase